MINKLRLAIIAICANALCGCAASYEHYDACAVESASFTAMVACGKQKRTAYCQDFPLPACSAEGNSVVAYADSLAASVNAKQMTEAEATRRWIEFKLGRSDADAAAAASRRAVTCVRVGKDAICQ